MLIKNIAQISSFLAGDQTYIREVLHPKNDPVDIQYSLAHASLPVGQVSLPHQLISSEVYYILNGKGKVSIDGEEQIVKVGDMVFIPSRATQYIENIGDVELTFLCIVHPEWKETEDRLV